MASADTTSPPARAAASAASSDLPAAVGPKSARTPGVSGAARSGRDGGGREGAAQGHRRCAVDANLAQLAGLGLAHEDHGLVGAGAAAQVGGVGARRALD